MKISIIVAVAENGVIGANNALLWRLSKDLQMFKTLTSGHHILMGRKTFDSIGKPLPNRTSIVISNSTSFLGEGVFVFNNIEKGIEFARSRNESELFIIGGGKIYEQVLPIADTLYYTKVHASLKGDAFFPVLSDKEWRILQSEKFNKDDKNEYDFDFQILEKTHI
ncbi:MAG: dihydrofolate reductase [Bacteroidota bacterium]|nr:dihydrofolate reductase [Bacteroidota bacterium]